MLLNSTRIFACLLASAVLVNGRHGRRLSSSGHHLATRNENADGAAGVVVTRNDVTSASATFKLPSLSEDGNGKMVIAIGLDLQLVPGKDCSNSLTGFLQLNDGPAADAYSAYAAFTAEQYPVQFEDLSLKAGDEVTVTVTLDGPTAGTVTINSYPITLTTLIPLCNTNAYFTLGASPMDSSNAGYYPLPKIGTFAFNDAKISTSTGTEAIKNDANVNLDDMTLDGHVVLTTKLEDGTIEFEQH